MQSVAIGALVTDITRQARWGAVVAATSFLVAGLVTPLGGVLADQKDRRRLFLFATGANALIAVVLAVLYSNGLVEPWVLVANTAIEGALVAIVLPARTAMLPDLVGRELVVDASALGFASFNLGRMVGPALAGVVIALGSYAVVFAINAVTFVGVFAAMFVVHVPQQPKTDETTLMARLATGFRVARDEPGCRIAILSICVTALFISPFIALVPAFAQLVFGGSAVDTAHFTIAQGVGAVVGALVFGGVVGRFGRSRSMRALILVLPAITIAYALAPSKIVAVVLIGFLGFTYVMVLAGLNAVIQLRAPSRTRARVVAIYMMALSLFYPVGSAVEGYLADRIGIRETLAGGAGLFLLICVFFWVTKPSLYGSFDSEPEPEPETTVALCSDGL